jgi:hypothetical protein
MRECRTYGSVRGVRSNAHSYRNSYRLRDSQLCQKYDFIAKCNICYLNFSRIASAAGPMNTTKTDAPAYPSPWQAGYFYEAMVNCLRLSFMMGLKFS